MENKTIQLNLFENLCYILDRASPFNVIISADFEGAVDAEMVKDAIEIVRKRHHYLNYFIKEYKNKPFFVIDEREIELSIISQASDNELHTVIENEMNTAFDLTKAPLLHATLLCYTKNTYVIVVNISHIISDGISVLFFVKDVLWVLSNIVKGKRVSLPILPDFRPDINLFPEINNGSIDVESEQATTICTDYINIKDRRSKISNVNLSSIETDKIIKICRSNNITVNSLLISVLIIALKEYIQKKYNIEDPFLLKSSSGLNLRDYFKIKVTPEQLGVYSGFGYVLHNSEEKTDPIKMAQEYGAKLKNKIKDGNPFWIVTQTAIKAQNIEPIEFAKYHESKIPYALITNLGKIDFSDVFGDIKVKKLSFVTPMHRNWKNDLGFGICALTYANKLDLNFIHMDPVWNSETSFKVISKVLKLLDTL